MKKTLKSLSLVIILGLFGYGIKFLLDYSYNGNDEIKLITNYEQISSISELVKNEEFKNKILYIDIWGVYCKPCIDEFNHKESLIDKYKDKDVVFIYMASPYGRINDTQQWKAALKKYDLYGHNMLMSMDFYMNIWDEIPEMSSRFEIPHYILIDRQGNVANPNAPMPSSKTELYTEIDKLLKPIVYKTIAEI